jgi:hypothetical protein
MRILNFILGKGAEAEDKQRQLAGRKEKLEVIKIIRIGPGW